MRIPQGQGQTQTLLGVGYARDSVFPPAVCAAARVIVREVVPRIAVRAVVLAHGSPLPLRQVWTPFLPALALGEPRIESQLFGGRFCHL